MGGWVGVSVLLLCGGVFLLSTARTNSNKQNHSRAAQHGSVIHNPTHPGLYSTCASDRGCSESAPHKAITSTSNTSVISESRLSEISPCNHIATASTSRHCSDCTFSQHRRWAHADRRGYGCALRIRAHDQLRKRRNLTFCLLGQSWQVPGEPNLLLNTFSCGTTPLRNPKYLGGGAKLHHAMPCELSHENRHLRFWQVCRPKCSQPMLEISRLWLSSVAPTPTMPSETRQQTMTDHDQLELREGRKTVLGSLEHERKILKILNDAKAPGKMHDPCESAAWFWQMTLCS